ncbi:hypothetical protein [Rhodanobacter lindaniclasticus]
MIVLYTVLWVVLLAALPWWLGLPALLALAAAVTLLQHRLAPAHAALIRRALRWGLPGWLFALQRALGGDAFAWGAALLGALAGYTLLAGLEAWLDRDLRRAPAGAPAAEWPELARAPIGPPAEIIELLLPTWHEARGELADPLGGAVHGEPGGCRFDDGTRVGAPGGFTQITFSPSGRWFAATTGKRSVLLWDRQRDRQYRLRGWQLCGWYREQPWLDRREDAMPLALSAVLGRDEDD